jgi:tRNA-Thr(GGU) m(6)t(6)A37 methyltransferase TsaA
MSAGDDMILEPVGRVVSVVTDPAQAPRQADEGAPPASIVLGPAVREAAAGISPGDRILVLTWLHLADRTVLRVHPRGDRTRAETGVFSTRSPDRPNPIGLHVVTVTAAGNGRIDVDALDAVDGTPVLDIKPVLGDVAGR